MQEERQATAAGALAGAIGGLLGTLAMATVGALWLRAFPLRQASGRRRRRLAHAGIVGGRPPQSEPRSHDRAITPGELMVQLAARRLTGRPLSQRSQAWGGTAAHFLFGACAGAAYGALAERSRWITFGQGTGYGVGVLLAADEAAMPMLGVAERPDQSSGEEHLYALAQHLAYGLVLETTRSLMRGRGRP